MLALGDVIPFLLYIGRETLEEFLVHSTANGSMLILFRSKLLNSLVENGVDYGAVFRPPSVIRRPSTRQLQLNSEKLRGNARDGIVCPFVNARLCGLIL